MPKFMRTFVFLASGFLALTFFASVVSAAPQAPSATGARYFSTFFPVAVWYGGGKARAPMLEPLDATSDERWGKDLDQIKGVGFNTVKCWVDWATAEPKPGEYHFENLDLLMRLAQQRGLRVIIQIYLDSAPDWVGKKYPDGRFVDRSGAVIESQAAPGFCIDHAGVRAEIVKFLEALSSDANRSKALYGWDVWSEPHVINWAEFPYLSNPEFCFCPSSQARFREWLKTKYETLAAINSAWYRRFTSWEQVEPPRASTILSYTDYLDWRAFIDDKLAGDLKTRVDSIRSADHEHFITSHAAVPGLFTSPTDGYGEPDDWKMSASADFFGTSLYPKHAASTRPWSPQMLAAGLDFTRSAGHSFGKGFWIGELQAGQGVTGMRIADPVDAHDEEYWMWRVIAHGAREIAVYAWYPMNSGYESNGYGLINLDGTLTPRARAAGKVAQAIAGNGGDLLVRTHPAPAQVAILYDRLAYMVGGAEPSLSKLGNATRDSLMGYHRAFNEQQIPVDFVHTSEVVQNKIGAYKILFLPFPVMLSHDAAQGVARYIEQGGTVVAEARLAWNDERGFSSDEVPGMGLAKVFGAREKVIRPAEKAAISLESAANLPGLETGATAVGEAFEEDLVTSGDARVLGRFANGEPAIVENRHGRGRAILVGTFLGLACQRQQAAATQQLVVALARAAGVEPEVSVSGRDTSQVEVRRLVGAHEQFLFVFNHAAASADATVKARVPWEVAEARDLASDQAVPFQTSGEKIVLRKTLAAGEVWVVRLKGR